MDLRYQKGKIYKIYNDEFTYYGSTIQTLKERLKGHITNKSCKSSKIIESNKYTIELVKNFPCNSRKELETEERKYIENNECINFMIPTQTRKEWREKNIVRLRAYDRTPERKKHCYTEKAILSRKIYNEKNKDKINEFKREKFVCPCGVVVSRGSYCSHIKTKKHLNNMANLTPVATILDS